MAALAGYRIVARTVLGYGGPWLWRAVIFITACVNDPAVVLALYLLLMHSILAWVAYYGNDHPMQQAYSTGAKDKQLHEITIYGHYAEFYIS